MLRSHQLQGRHGTRMDEATQALSKEKAAARRADQQLILGGAAHWGVEDPNVRYRRGLEAARKRKRDCEAIAMHRKQERTLVLPSVTSAGDQLYKTDDSIQRG